eukprot:CAMPEP_0114290374 /NCGR_PEP_ID=MMETSP0059-20121206/7899_1 /TAXON_ID=36894 /ORGANISM="Pyramimonas parkeae, Strain CCMP726" /LENGTH=57 /DNA_ID=CAMNT_0001411761 /DNA_START=1236 /DNA_END=1405 /DNA_ORIENTATION=+
MHWRAKITWRAAKSPVHEVIISSASAAPSVIEGGPVVLEVASTTPARTHETSPAPPP